MNFIRQIAYCNYCNCLKALIVVDRLLNISQLNCWGGKKMLLKVKDLFIRGFENITNDIHSREMVDGLRRKIESDLSRLSLITMRFILNNFYNCSLS